MLRLVMRGLFVGAAFFGICVAFLGGATTRMVGTYWGVGILVVVATEAWRGRRARRVAVATAVASEGGGR